MLLQIGDRIVQIRPLQELELDEKFDHPYLKLVSPPKKQVNSKKSTWKVKEKKKDVPSGNSSDTSSN